MTDVKLPSRKKVVDLPERPKDRNEQTRERAREKIATADANLSLQQIQMKKQLAAKMGEMTPEQVDTLKAYAEASTMATKQLAKSNYGPMGSMEQGAAEIDKLTLNLTDVLMAASKGTFGMNEFFAMLGATAGFQAGVAMAKNNTEMTEGMIKTSTMIFEGGLRMISESARVAYKDNKVIRPATKLPH